MFVKSICYYIKEYFCCCCCFICPLQASLARQKEKERRRDKKLKPKRSKLKDECSSFKHIRSKSQKDLYWKCLLVVWVVGLYIATLFKSSLNIYLKCVKKE